MIILAAIQIRDLSIAYRSKPDAPPFYAVKGLNLTVAEGEFVSIVGPSGCGKSTLLYALDGLRPVDSGQIQVLGKPVDAPGPDRAMVFQEFGLFPWLSVLGNVRFGLEMLGIRGREADDKAQHYIELVGLRGFAASFPHELSGGMRQRVGLARALAVNPKILLMDEPFGALDAQTREMMGEELLKIWDKEKKTVLFITHDIDEAVFLSDRVAVFTSRPGRVETTISIDLPRPRPAELRNTPEHMHYRKQIWELIAQQVRVAAADDRGGVAS